MAKKSKTTSSESNDPKLNSSEQTAENQAETSTENEAENATADDAVQWEEKVAQAEDRYMRLFAEFDNYKKRAAKEKLDLIQSAGKDLLERLIPVIDDLERAMKNIRSTDDVESVKEGVELIHKKLFHQLGEFGLKAMDSAIGQPLDTDFHEAITTTPAPDKSQVGKIIDEIEKGYMLKDRVLRFAKVVVGE